jgi:hypothetical protein
MHEESEVIEDWPAAEPLVLTAQSFKERIFFQSGYANPGASLSIRARWKEMQQAYITVDGNDLGAFDYAVASVIERNETVYLLLGLTPPDAADCAELPFFLVKLLDNDTVQVIDGEDVDGILTLPFTKQLNCLDLVERHLGSLLTWEELNV